MIADRLEDFRARDLQPTDVVEFLKAYSTKPKTFNLYRAQIGDLMRFAILKGWRQLGTDPVRNVIPTLKTPPRDRYPTDSEVRRIKVARISATVRSDAKPGATRQKNRSGLMLAALVDMAYLTGQRIGDLIALEWSDVGQAGILFKPAKTERSTVVSVLIEWTTSLRDVVARLKTLRKERRAFGPYVFTKQASSKRSATSGQPHTYGGAHSTWTRARKRAGI